MSRPVAFIIEDQINLVMLYEDTLRLIGYDVVKITHGLDAINKIETSPPPTLIILDVNLPGASGRDIWQHIRKHPRYKDVPVIIATANTLMAARLEQELGPHDQLFIKPVSFKKLQDIAKQFKDTAAQKEIAPAAQQPEASAPAEPAAAPSAETPAPVVEEPQPEPVIPFDKLADKDLLLETQRIPNLKEIQDSVKDLMETQKIPWLESIEGVVDILETQRIPDLPLLEDEIEEGAATTRFDSIKEDEQDSEESSPEKPRKGGW